MHGAKPRVLSDYGRSLIEKQKVRFYYLLKEKQFKNLLEKAAKMKEPVTIALIKLLESKLDNVIWRLGYTDSRLHAKQLVSHGHFLVNGKRVKSSFIFLKPGDIIEVRSQSKNKEPFKNLQKKLKIYNPPPWLKIDINKLKGEFLRYPETEELNLPFNIPLALQFYSR